jgi:hypothetical protein
LAKEVNRQIIDHLRETYVADITAIVKDCLKRDELYSHSSEWMTIQDATKRYHISRKSIGEHCRDFKTGPHKIERKQIGRHNMINEQQFLAAYDFKKKKPKLEFLESIKRK